MQINVRGHKMNLSNILPLFVLTVIWAVVPTFVSSRLWLSVFVLVFIKATASVSLRTLGLSGNISFAHGSFMAVGAYTAAILANNLGVPAYITIPAGAVIAMLIGILTGFPFIRLRSLYFTMASMFLGLSIVFVILPEISRSMNQYSPFITAAVVVAIAYLLPGGLASMPNVIKQSVSNRRERRAIAVTKAEDE